MTALSLDHTKPLFPAADLSGFDFALERPQDAAGVDHLVDRAFGPGRFAKAAERLREGNRQLIDPAYQPLLVGVCVLGIGGLIGAIFGSRESFLYTNLSFSEELSGMMTSLKMLPLYAMGTLGPLLLIDRQAAHGQHREREHAGIPQAAERCIHGGGRQQQQEHRLRERPPCNAGQSSSRGGLQHVGPIAMQAPPRRATNAASVMIRFQSFSMPRLSVASSGWSPEMTRSVS